MTYRRINLHSSLTTATEPIMGFGVTKQETEKRDYKFYSDNVMFRGGVALGYNFQTALDDRPHTLGIRYEHGHQSRFILFHERVYGHNEAIFDSTTRQPLRADEWSVFFRWHQRAEFIAGVGTLNINNDLNMSYTFIEPRFTILPIKAVKALSLNAGFRVYWMDDGLKEVLITPTLGVAFSMNVFR